MALLHASSGARNGEQVLNRCGVRREDPVSTDARAKAHAFAWLFAEKADFGISPAMIASPTRWMLGCSVDSNVTGSTGHHPDRSARPICCARCPAFWAGMTLATAALTVSSAVITERALTSTALTPPVNSAGSHSIIPG